MKVLIAIDSSSYADEVLAEVAMRSWPSNVEFYVITVVEQCPDWENHQAFMHQSRVILEQRIDSLRKRLPKNQITEQVLEGSATSVITKTAQECGAHLIIIGSHGDTGIRKTGIGSVAAAVVNEAPCSVEVVKLCRKHLADTTCGKGSNKASHNCK